jgi:hypothetical protein
MVKIKGTAIAWALNIGEGNNTRNRNIILLDRSFCYWKNCKERGKIKKKHYLLYLK